MTIHTHLSSKICFLLILFVFYLVSPAASAWNRVGHQLIAQIAFDQLTPQSKRQVARLNRVVGKAWGRQSFVRAAAWADGLYAHDIKVFSSWHYISRPYSTDGTPGKPYDKHNIVWAIEQAQMVLKSRKASVFEKGLFLRFLIHLVGDIHQPLHCIGRFSKEMPAGDKGGNLFVIKAKNADNLHQLWDRGVGYFATLSHHRSLSNKQLRQIAHRLEVQYPRSAFRATLSMTEPKQWAQKHYQLAKTQIYRLSMHSKPEKTYILKGQHLVAKQVVLAGYRLGDILNQLF